ncbi:hypothetical protein KBT16_22790 [Nostoc sp. CCCryo 231-06]|nr:hypothetical protein [Nostoc sp. CCCryo 231-06]
MYSNELNSQQNAIARYTEGSILVLASDRSPQSSEENPGRRSHPHFSEKTNMIERIAPSNQAFAQRPVRKPLVEKRGKKSDRCLNITLNIIN